MSEIILPHRFRQQPQTSVGLDRSNPYFRYIKFAYSAGRGLQDGAHPGRLGSLVGSISSGAGRTGSYIKTNDTSSYAQFANLDDYNVLGHVTVVARIRTAWFGSQQSIVIKTEGGGGTQTPYGLLIEYDGAISFNRSNSSGGANFRVWASSVKLATDTDYVITVTQDADMSVAPRFYVNGILDTGAATSIYGGSGTGSPTATTQSLKLGNRTDLANSFPGDIRDILILSDVMSPHGVARLSENIDQIWAPSKRLWRHLTVSGTTGIGATTEEADTIAAVGTTTVTGVGSFTDENDTVNGSGSPVVVGSGAIVEGDDTVSASGAAGSDVVGVGNFSEEDDIIFGVGTSTITGAGSFTEDNDLFAGLGVVGTEGTIGVGAFTEESDVVSAAGSTSVIAVGAILEEDDVITAGGLVIPRWVLGNSISSSWEKDSSLSSSWTKQSPLQ